MTRETAREREAHEDSPRSIAARVLPMALYGLPQLEDEESELRSTNIGALRRDDIAHAYEAALDPSSASLIVIGDATEKTLRPMLEKSFGAWRGHGRHPPSKATRPTVTTSSPRIVVVDHPGSQSLVTFGGEGPSYSSADWAPSLALRMIVNGPRGRAAVALRGVNLVATGSGLNLSANPAAPRLTFSAEVPTERTAETLDGIERVMRATKSAEIAPGELDDARRPLAIEESSRTSTLVGETDVLEGLVVQGLSRDDVPKRTARYLAVTADDVRRVAARYLDPDRMKIVIVGDWSKLREPIAHLGWGPVEVRDSSGAIDPSRSTR